MLEGWQSWSCGELLCEDYVSVEKKGYLCYLPS